MVADEQPARVLPLFPLDAVVLFPGTRVPLHVFEPRYRQMTSDVLAGERVVGMVAVRPEHHHEMAGSPPLYTVGCAGTVERWRKLPDGRFDLLLRGTERFRLLRELAADGRRLYRRAEVGLLGESPAPRADEAAAARERLLELLEETARLRAGEDGRLDPSALQPLLELADAEFANALAQCAPLSTVERQGLLEAEGPGERLRLLEETLRFHRAALGRAGSGPAGSETLH